MEIPVKWLRVAAITLFVVILALLIFDGISVWHYNKKISDLQNAVAEKDKTIETHVGVYQKLMVEHEDLMSLLDKKETQIKLLTNDLKKDHETILSANQLGVRWKKAYEALAIVTQHHEPGTSPVQPGGAPQPGRDVVEFNKDFGYIFVVGWTKTNPPEAYVKVEQKRPLQLTLVVAQKEDDSWESHVTSSEENVGVDIKLAGVNPRMLDVRWYERIGISMDVGVGANGFLGAVGASYTFGKFEVGPKVWAAIGGTGVATYYGASLTWHPFNKH